MSNQTVMAQRRLMPITVQNITLTLNERTLINDLSCIIKSDGISVIMGPNGAGKSLFMRCLHGLAKPDMGQILYADTPLDPVIRQQQSLVFQTPTILRRTVLANLLFVARQRGIGDPKISMDYLAQLQLDHLAQHPARLLSGGEKQRLALARALIINPAILFLETIETNLQSVSKQGMKLILVTHDVGQAKRLADDVLFLHHGKLAEHSPAKSFFQKPKSAAARAYLAGKLVL
jgi:tungstate transport system ATP-binding protein